ncbi:hypothetical protein [Flavobacterium sp.]|uniref:hypothetical protein n=1 Tax=Flavobacterium sp. TaxID=239 RepID=UPI00352977C3
MRLLKIAIATCVALLSTSCSITENLIINEDGTGKYAFDLDASQLISMAGNRKNSDTLEENAKKEDIDSIISFKEIFAEKKDSIAQLSAAEQARLKKMENFKIHMLIKEADEVMKYSMFADFTTVNELDEMMSPLQSMTIFGIAKDDLPTGINNTSATTDAAQQFFYDGATFKKSLKAKEKQTEVETVVEDEETESEAAFSKQHDESIEMLFAQSHFKIKYTFPKAVKKVTSKYEVMYSEDRKTITIEMPFKEYMNDVEKSNIEVIF